MNTDAAFFASIVVAIIAVLTSFVFYNDYGLVGAVITIIGAIIWVGLGFYFKKSGSNKN